MDIYIYDAIRTPRGKSKDTGGLAEFTPHELVRQLIEALKTRASPDAIERAAALTLGCVGQIGAQGGHLALVSRLHAGLPDQTRATTVNNYCVSGMTAAGMAAHEAAGLKDDRLRIAGGVEMMSRVPFMGDHAFYYDDPATSAALRYVPVVLSADLMATMEGFEKDALDAVTARSHQRAAAARDLERGEIIAIRREDGSVALEQDECVRPQTTEEALSAMAPAFAEMGASGFDAIMLKARPELSEIRHVHSVANCPPTCDGASLIVLGSKAAGEAAGLKPRARIRALAEATGDPVLQLTSGFAAMDLALERAGLGLSDLDQIEFMEAFAATPVKFERDYKPDLEKMNPEGGHLAAGHPMGASGAILISTLLAGLERRGGQTGLAVAHGGSGVGSAIVIERV